MNKLLGLMAGVSAVFALGGCASPPPPPLPPAPASYVALLQNDDGTTGKVQITTADGVTQLDRALQGVRFSDPAGQTFEVSKDKIDKDFGAALAASPLKPVSFLLYFQVGGAKLTAESEADIGKIAEELNKRPVPDISVIGHTDTAGEDEANEKLGLQRATSIAALISSGNKIEAGKISVESHGEKNLLVPTPDNTNEPRNRRVEVTVR
jgi:peptidoglycan-associated lipoprotein